MCFLVVQKTYITICKEGTKLKTYFGQECLRILKPFRWPQKTTTQIQLLKDYFFVQFQNSQWNIGGEALKLALGLTT